MDKAQDQHIRAIRAYLANAIAVTISSVVPYIKADERRKVWSKIDRFDVCEHVSQLAFALNETQVDLNMLPRKVSSLKAGEKVRFSKLFKAIKLSESLANQMTEENMNKADAKYASEMGREASRRAGTTKGHKGKVFPNGQRLFVYQYRLLLIWLRRALASMFYLVKDVKIRVVRLSQEDSAEYYDPRYRHLREIKVEEMARELAHKTGKFVEIEAIDPDTLEVSVIFDASPHPATVRKEMGVAQRKEKRAWPYVANAAQDIEVWLGLYEMA